MLLITVFMTPGYNPPPPSPSPPNWVDTFGNDVVNFIYYVGFSDALALFIKAAVLRITLYLVTLGRF